METKKLNVNELQNIEGGGFWACLALTTALVAGGFLTEKGRDVYMTLVRENGCVTNW